MKVRIIIFTLLLIIGVFAMTPQIKAQTAGDYTITHSTIDGGGVDQASDGVYTISATLGQWDAGQAAIGQYTLHSGFWFPQTTTVPTAIQLSTGTSQADSAIGLLSSTLLLCGILCVILARRKRLA